jgi:putative PIN family toxin of toxin-antitoxin system
MTLRVVIDTNIYLSAILFGGAPAALLLRANHGEFHVIISEHILREVERKLLDKFKRDPAVVRWELQQLRLLSEMVLPSQTIQACRDEDDNRILECAVAGKADFIVTGDRDLLALHPFENIPVLTVRQFVDQFPDQQPSPSVPSPSI